jgi:uncharacterized OsmC-like protein
MPRMASLGAGLQVNGLDVAELRAEMAAIEADRAAGDREASITTRWVGGLRSAATSRFGGPTVFMGGEEDPGAMGMLLRALAACDVEVIVTRASLLGLRLDGLWIEAKGSFNVAPYLGLASPEGAGYQEISFVVHMNAPGATAEHIEEIRTALAASPVGDTLTRHVPVSFELDAS